MINLLNILPVVPPNINWEKPELTKNPWQLEEDDYPVNGTIAAQLKFLLNYAILAPSGHNTQPWLFKLADDAVELYADRTRALSVADPSDRELTISCGAALFNLRLAIRHFGYREVVETLPEPQNPDLLARIRFGSKRSVKPEERLLFRAIPKRSTNRLPFAERQLPASLLLELQQAKGTENTRLQITPQIIAPDKREAAIDLITRGDRLQMADPLFRRELAKWIRSSTSDRHDGIPASAQGMDERLDKISPLIAVAIRFWNLGKFQSIKDQKLAEQAPVLILLQSTNDTPQDWLATGEALEHLLLRARVDNVWASFFNQPIQIPELRSRLQALYPENGYPQILLRLGYAKKVKPTPRRSVDEAIGGG